MVVDDDPGMRRLIRFALASRPYEIVEVSDGLRALAAATQHEPQVIVLDIGLPGLHGYSVCQQLKAASTQARIIMISGLPRSVHDLVGHTVGVDAYLQKPFRAGELLRAVESLLSAEASSSEN
jgi:two-component system KDP operon response regulator KdpE